MRIDVAALEIGQVRRAAFDEVVDSKSEDLAFDTPVRGNVEVDRTAQTLRLRGHLATTAPFVCGRCLTQYRQDIAIAVEEDFLVGDIAVPRDGPCDPRTLSSLWGLIWCWTLRKPYGSTCCWPCRWSRSAAPTAGGCAPGVGRISTSRSVDASLWRRLIRASRRCGISRTHGANSPILTLSGR